MRIKLSILLLLAYDFLFLTPVPIFSMPWSKDMFNQPSVKAQEYIQTLPPMGIVPTRGKERPIKDRTTSAELQNPVALSIRSLTRGKIVYDIHCAPCHGESGIGNGVVGRKFAPPTDLSSGYVQDKAVGDIYFTIKYGGLFAMPVYVDAVPSEDRWHIINYIKETLKSYDWSRGQVVK